MANNNIAGRFRDCKSEYQVHDILKSWLRSDFIWYLRDYEHLLPEAVDLVDVTVDKYNLYRYTHKFNILITTKDGKYKHELTLSDEDYYFFCMDNTYYDSFLLGLYLDYHTSYYKYEFAEQIYQKRLEAAKAIVAMISPYSGERIRPIFCSCCGARLKEDSNKCDYCGASYVMD